MSGSEGAGETEDGEGAEDPTPGAAQDVRADAMGQARRAVEDHAARLDVQAVRTSRLLDDLKDAADALDQRLDEWPDPPGPTEELRATLRSEIARLEGRLEDLLGEASPNLLALLGPNLAGRMLAEAGDLEALARLAVTQVQVLGAKRAVLRAKRGAKPPKHGLLFLHPVVGGAPRGERGRRAKDLAALVTLAARADAYTGRDLRDELRARMEDLGGDGDGGGSR